MSEGFTELWHVVDGAWDGCDLQPLVMWMTKRGAKIYIDAKWPNVSFEEYWEDDATQVHFYTSAEVAEDYAGEGDDVLRVDVRGLKLQDSTEKPAYPCFNGTIEARRCEPIQ